jgi:DNA-binding FrmR family transcriptional regulator
MGFLKSVETKNSTVDGRFTIHIFGHMYADFRIASRTGARGEAAHGGPHSERDLRLAVILSPRIGDSMKHRTHPEIVTRLKRANGHLSAILKMFEEARPCVDLAQQLHAVESAVSNAKRELIHDHIEHCLDGPDGDTKIAMRELKQLAKYL